MPITKLFANPFAGISSLRFASNEEEASFALHREHVLFSTWSRTILVFLIAIAAWFMHACWLERDRTGNPNGWEADDQRSLDLAAIAVTFVYYVVLMVLMACRLRFGWFSSLRFEGLLVWGSTFNLFCLVLSGDRIGNVQGTNLEQTWVDSSSAADPVLNVVACMSVLMLTNSCVLCVRVCALWIHMFFALGIFAAAMCLHSGCIFHVMVFVVIHSITFFHAFWHEQQLRSEWRAMKRSDTSESCFQRFVSEDDDLKQRLDIMLARVSDVVHQQQTVVRALEQDLRCLREEFDEGTPARQESGRSFHQMLQVALNSRCTMVDAHLKHTADLLERLESMHVELEERLHQSPELIMDRMPTHEMIPCTVASIKDLAGKWNIIARPNGVAPWLRTFTSNGDQVTLGSGDVVSLQHDARGRLSLEGGKLAISENVLLRTGKSGKTLRFMLDGALQDEKESAHVPRIQGTLLSAKSGEDVHVGAHAAERSVVDVVDLEGVLPGQFLPQLQSDDEEQSEDATEQCSGQE
eukprot:TRINITY_DN72129_c0_g1_i1.p1 TRINITY_DN72129_c0_g1~~TRINITY_DN72129_c0_g1_i1.p1  ORF type:complete len:523 (+),score=62.22 TRINITY_DN72129_c0_g1_i1:55-1623(+)